MPSSFICLRAAVAAVGERMVSGWTGSERRARLWMEPPRKPNFESSEDPAGAIARVYDPDGLPRDVSLEEADAWWDVELPSLYRDWQEEIDAAGRWEQAVDLVRDWLAQERLESSCSQTMATLKPFRRRRG